jgi:hypothetical protein
MTFTSAKVRRTVVGNLRMEIWSFVATGVSTGTIVTGLNSIEHIDLSNNTGARAGQSATITGGSVALAGLTASDAGTIMVFGH